VLLILLLASLVLAQQNVPEHLRREYEKKLEEMKNYRPPSASPELKKELEQRAREAQQRALQERSRFELKDGKVIMKESFQSPPSLAEDLVFYVAMSSSVPKAVWSRYMDFVEKEGLAHKVAFVLRGCVGGCTYIKPTLEFLMGILKDGQRERGVGVMIDPFIFRRFGIKEVPCVVMVKGDQVWDVSLSAGREDNLRVKGLWAISCGDWSMGYHFKVLCEKSKESEVCQLSRKYSPY